MRSKRVKSYALVAIQFACLVGLALTAPIMARPPWLLAIEVAALALAVWAIITIRIGNINVTPDVRPSSRLVREGPYRFVRHPIYASLLLGALTLVVSYSTTWRWVMFLVLLVDLIVKMSYEEQLLAAHFPLYRAYQETSKRLIPFIY